MGTTEVQRTLVKSPPELWSELSDQDSLGRLLSDLGEVRIVSTVADSAVYWEGDEVTGSALLKQAGWGTKVTLTVTLATPDTPPRRPPCRPWRRSAPPRRRAIPLTAAALRGPPSPITSTGDRAHLADSGAIPAATGDSCPGPRSRRPTTLGRASCRTHPIRRRPAPPRSPTPRAPRGPTRLPPALDAADRTSEDGEPTRRGFFARLFGRRSRRREEPVRRPASTPARGTVPRARRATRHAAPTALEALQARYGVRPPRSRALPPPRRLCPGDRA